MREEQTKQERMLAVEDGSELLLAWSLQYPELGNAVEIVTGASVSTVLAASCCFTAAVHGTCCEVTFARILFRT